MLPEDNPYRRKPEENYILEEDRFSQKLPLTDDEYFSEPEVRDKIVRMRESIVPRGLDEGAFETLNLQDKGIEVIGNVFDRVEFLKKRVSELNCAIADRREVHENNIAELDADIADREDTLTRIVEIDDVRDFKLDLSMLRREKRREKVQFWKDVLELKSELGTLEEELEMESKIAKLFNDLED